MATTTVITAAASATVGVDLMDGQKLQTSPMQRKVTKIGVVGSTAIADFAVELFYGSVFMGKFYNTTAGASKIPTANADMITVGGPLRCAPNDPIHLFVADAANTENVAVTLQIQEFVPGR